MSPSAFDASKALTFTYRNYRGEIGQRRVFPISFRFGTTEWHPESSWLMLAWDFDKEAKREFALADICMPGAPDPISPTGETDEAFVARVSAEIITLDYDTSALERYADLARCGAIARSTSQATRDEVIDTSKDAVEQVARALYDCEKRRAFNAQGILQQASGKPCDGIAIEPWEECADIYRGDACAAIRALRTDRKLATQEDSAQKDDLFDSLKLEHIVREWFSSPMCKDLPQSVIDGFVDVLRFRLRRAAPPGSLSRDGGV